MAEFDRAEFIRQIRGFPARVTVSIAVCAAMRVLPILPRGESGWHAFGYWPESRQAMYILSIFRAHQTAIGGFAATPAATTAPDPAAFAAAVAANGASVAAVAAAPMALERDFAIVRSTPVIFDHERLPIKRF